MKRKRIREHRKRLPTVQAKHKADGPTVKTVHVSELSRLKMVCGNEQKYRIVIDGDTMKEWIGFGWIDIRPASAADRKIYPRVVRDSSQDN